LKILVYTPQITPRIQFSVHLIFRDVLKQQVELTSDEKKFKESDAPKIAYSYKRISDELLIVPSDLLHQSGIDQFSILVEQGADYPYFFKTKNGDFEFDLFSAAFFLVTRYEEYWPHKRDKHNRFSARESVAYKNNFLQLPVVDLWANHLLDELTARHKDRLIDNREYTFSPTIDVDSAYAYREKGLIRTAGAYARSLFQGKISEIKQRTQCILGISKDPYDVFDQLVDLQKQYRIKFLYFFLVADYGLNDKNVPHYSRKFQSLIKHVNDYSFVGLHPSFASNENHEKVKVEKERLQQMVHLKITNSRQHFLIFHLPSTYRNLIESGIRDDHSMGYPDESGFRASICNSYQFYDLEMEQESPLRIHPFCFMEATYKYYKEENFDELIGQVKKLSGEVRRVKGEFSVLWHNDSLSEIHGWEGWSPLFEKMIQIAK
tara:strand:+ start:8179 stop:9480 length:1302 start_codon:yes stop_codon:yes gene_type:complete